MEINPAVYDFYLFKIGDRMAWEIIPSEEIAINFLKKTDSILGSKDGFYSEFSIHIHFRALQFILMRYPNLHDSAFNLQQKFISQIWTAYYHFVQIENLKDKFIIGGIICDIYNLLDETLILMEHVQRFYPNDIGIRRDSEEHRKKLIEFLTTEIILSGDDRKIEKMRNYDMVCWYDLNCLIQSPEIISYNKKIVDEQNILLDMKKSYIKEKYGVS